MKAKSILWICFTIFLVIFLFCFEVYKDEILNIFKISGQNTTTNDLKINFLEKPEKVNDLALISKEFTSDDENFEYFKVGDFSYNGKKGSLFFTHKQGVYGGKFYFAEVSGEYFFIESISEGYYSDGGRFFSEKVSDKKDDYLEKYFGNIYKIEKNVSFEKDQKKYNLVLEGHKSEVFDEKVLQKVDFIKGDFYIQKPELYKSELQESDFFSLNYIYKKLPDNTILTYILEIPTFKFNDSNQLQKEINQNYIFRNDAGCSNKNGAFVLNGKLNFKIEYDTEKSEKVSENMILTYKNEDLESIGRTNYGEILFFKDKNHDFLKGLYKSKLAIKYIYDVDKDYKDPNYEEFVKTYPILFWKDPFDRILAFIKGGVVYEFEMVCGGKPVIYLYPKEKTEVSVKLDWEKKELVSIPKYKDIWKVTAYPSGKIEYNGKNYPYLFWEDSLNLDKKSDGFVVKKENIEKFLDEKLRFLGLNTKEISDFKEFWLPKFNNKKYYFIRFYGNETLDKIATISVNPKPDSIQRVFMDYKGLDEKVEVVEQKLKKFERKGFSVIEWGGNYKK
ncbi:hypothetical protein HXK64_02405 [Candidatus Gracilibacteria bacterium]|nr:hypothetical protein [Candidatus Gracilibacteria bacterium]